MVQSGNWATPSLNELDYVEKPPLWYWLAAASYKVFGVSEAAARFPLALLSILGLLGTAWFGSWLYSPKTGIAAAAALASTALYFFLSHYITPDLGLTVFLLWSTAMILRVLLRPEDARWAAPAAWAFAGLAFLSKGLIALVFPMGWAIACLVLFPTLRKNALKLLHPLGPVLLLAIVSPWLYLMETRHPGFLHVFFVEQHFQRFTTLKYNRFAPWYFFFLVLPAGLLPWTPAVFSGAVLAEKQRRAGDPRGAALAVWAGMIFLFFTKSNSKLATYILPVFPHLCLLGAHALEQSDKLKRALKLSLAGLALGALALIAAGTGKASDLLSARAISQRINEKYRPGDQVYTYGTYLHAIPFYTKRRVDVVVNWVGELHYAKRDPKTQDRFSDDRAIRELPAKGHGVFVVLRKREADYFLTLTEPKKPKAYTTFGNWILAEY